MKRYGLETSLSSVREIVGFEGEIHHDKTKKDGTPQKASRQQPRQEAWLVSCDKPAGRYTSELRVVLPAG